MEQRANFIKVIRFWGIIFLIGFGISIIATDILISNYDFTRRAEKMRTDFVTRQEQMVKQEVDQVVDEIYHRKEQGEKLAKKEIENRVNEALSIAQNIYQENTGKKDDDEIKKMILNALRAVRFENGNGYYFISDLNGVSLLFPSKPELEGKNQIEAKDAKGKLITKEMIDIVNKSDGGFIEYHWNKPGASKNDLRKISFVNGLNILTGSLERVCMLMILMIR